jgi:hypothetical protein
LRRTAVSKFASLAKLSVALTTKAVGGNVSLGLAVSELGLATGSIGILIVNYHLPL